MGQNHKQYFIGDSLSPITVYDSLCFIVVLYGLFRTFHHETSKWRQPTVQPVANISSIFSSKRYGHETVTVLLPGFAISW